MSDKKENGGKNKKNTVEMDIELKETGSKNDSGASGRHTSDSSPEEWEDVGREKVDSETTQEDSKADATVKEKSKTLFESETESSLSITKTESSTSSSKSDIPSKDSSISMEAVESDDVDIIDSEEVQHQIDKMVIPETVHKHEQEEKEDEESDEEEFHLHPKPKLHILTKPIDNTEVETDAVDTPRPEEIMKITDKMVLGFDIEAYKRRKDDKIIEEDEVSTGNNSPATVAKSASPAVVDEFDSGKDRIGVSKEAECILTETIKIEKIEDKPYEVEDVLEIIDETHEYSGDPVELEEIKKRLKAEAKELEEAIHLKILEVKEKDDDENDEQQPQQEEEESQDINKDDDIQKPSATTSDAKIVKSEGHESTTDESDNSESSDSESSKSDESKDNNQNVAKTEQQVIQGLPPSLQKLFQQPMKDESGDLEAEDKIGIEAAGRQRADLKEKRKRRETTSPRPQDLIGALKLTSINFQNRQNMARQQSLDTPMAIKVPPPTPAEGLDSLKLKSPPEFAAPGPEVFHEVPIDVPVDEKRHIAFDIDDFTESIKKRISDDDDADEPYEKSRLEKFVNYLLCRRDLVDQKLSEKPVKFWDLFKYGSRGDTILVIFGLMLAAICGICQPLFAILSGRLANVLLLMEIDDPEFFSEGTQACVLFVVIGAFLVALAFAQFLCFNIACTRITRRIRNAYLLSILRQNPAWFEKNHSGALNTRLNDNIERIYEGIGDKLGLLTRNMVQYITGIIVAMFVSWQMALPLLIFSPIITFAMAFSGRKISKASRDEMKVYSQAGCIAEEAITAYRTVAAFNAQETEVHRYRSELENGVRSGVRKAVYSGALSGVLLALVMIFMGTALLYGTFLHSIGIITTPGDVFVVLMAIMSGAYHLGNASPHLMVLLTARVAAASVYKTIARIPKIDPYSNEGRKLYDLQGKIIFKNVSFRYPSRPDTKVLKSFSFTCNAGQTIALVGHSGSGKSTIVGILNRLYEFETGQVTIDGVDIRELNVKWLRTVIGTVQQEPIIFNDTVENNIKQGCDTLTEKEMVEACKMANAHDFIESLPEGYNTRIGEGGVQLSGGQKQRIAIARTMARNPKILLLDEATSALDTHSEAMVQNALNNASKNRTTIVIAHRLSTIRDADRIIVMHKGRFVEMGTHNDLIQRKGAYSKLVLAQELNMGDDKKDISDEDDEESIEKDLISPDQPTAGLTLASKDIRESVRQSFQRDFLASDHVGDAETEAYNIELEKSGYKQTSFGQIFLDARELWPLLSIALGICFFNALAMPVNAFIYGQAFQMFEDGKRDNVGEAFIFFLFFVGLGVVALIASFCTTYLFGKIGEKLTMSMRVRAFRSIIYQDGSYFDNPAHTPGKLITRLATDAPNVKAAMDTRLARVAQGILALLAAVVISVFMDWKFALTCSLAFVFLGIFQFTIAKMAHSQAVKFAQSDEAGRIAIEAIENVRTIQLLTSEHNVHNNFTICSLKRQKAEMRKAPIEALNFATTHGLQYFTLAFCYMMGFIFVVNGWTYKVTLFQVVQTIYFGAIAVIQATEFFPEFVKSRLAASLIYAIINRQPRTGKIDAGEKISIEGDVNFENVYFAYPMRPKHAVMKGISLQARPGQTVALVGPSGSGKSTVVALLERLYDPSVGAVKIDGKDLKNLCLYNIRNQMSLVEQQPRLFSGTIKDNIAYGLDINKITMDEIVEAATLANAASFISTLPLGYDTPLGEKGAQLSGGQKQRIAIARAVIRKPKILLLDEATSALDSTSEKAVQDALDVARLGRTCITIAHRLSSIQNSDQILFVENGKVRERGTHSELIQQQGKYYNLTQQQYLGS